MGHIQKHHMLLDMTQLSKEAIERHRKARGKLRGGGIMMDELASKGLLGPQSRSAPPSPHGDYTPTEFPRYGPISRKKTIPPGAKNAQ